MRKPPKRPRDTAQLAKLVVEIATGQVPDSRPTEVSERAIARGVARKKALSKKRRKQIASKAAKARWRKAR
jgi:hypothetical protein